MAQPRQDLTIGGIDFSENANKWVWKCEPVPRTGPNGGQAKSGRVISDLLGYALKFTFQLNGMTAEDAVELIAACGDRYVEATVLDPVINRTRTAWFVPTIPPVEYAYTRAGGGRLYKNGGELILEEREPHDYST